MEEYKPKKGEDIQNPHRIIRVWLDIKDISASQLDVHGVTKIDIIDYKTSPEMKRKYLYRDRVGAAAPWGFTPLHKLGKPKKDPDAKRKVFLGEKGNWQEDKKSGFYKLKNRLLSDYEACEVLSEGSVDRIMQYLEAHIDQLVDLFEGKGSFIILFGADFNGRFVYPGDIPAFVDYFQEKLTENVTKKSREGKPQNSSGPEKKSCFCCASETLDPGTLDKVFKFSTFDKVNVIPGLEDVNKLKVQPVCQNCLQNLIAGREKIERELSDKSTISEMVIWLVPEVVTAGDSKELLDQAIRKLNVADSGATGMGKGAERIFARKLSKQDAGLVFHFLFWEKQNAQERIHLMVEDVPPSRLSFLENAWTQAVTGIGIDWQCDLDTAISTVYSTFISLSGTSKEDKKVMRDIIVRIIGKMLAGSQLPTNSVKTLFVSRIPKLVFDSDRWSNVRLATKKAQLVVEFFEKVNKEGKVDEARFVVS